ncbi:anti-anti-sigma factor [Streptomyces eurythermus]|uniref:anti-anti-sigma factor n=1 Tax=Streptomyces eurythermus TaxID=42237 RepID=UPI0033E8A7C6
MTGLSATRRGPVPVPALGEGLPVISRGEPYDGAAGHLRHDIAGRAAAGPAPAGGAVTGTSGAATAGCLPGRALAGTVDPFRGRLPAETIDFMPGRVPAEIADSFPGRVLAGTAGTACLPATGDAPATRTVLAGTRPAPGIGRALSLPDHGPSAIPSAHPEEGA